MSESNYNFRQALKDIKLAKKAEILLEVDNVLRGILGKIAEGKELYLEEALNQLIFVQDDIDIDTYIKNVTEGSNTSSKFIRVATYRCNSFNDATNLIMAIRLKLISEQFVIEDHQMPHNIRGTNGFIVDTRDR